jgi:hypothetical protein
MRRSSIVMLIVLAAIAIATAVAMHGEGGGRLRTWLSSLHGPARH